MPPRRPASTPGQRTAEQRERDRQLREQGREPTDDNGRAAAEDRVRSSRFRSRPPGRGERPAAHHVTTGRVAAALALVAVAFVAWFAISLWQPFTGSGSGKVVVTIPRGDGARAIGDLLAEHGVVSSGFFFNLYAAVNGDRGVLHSGTYTLRKGMSYSAAIAIISKPPPPPPIVRVVIPEGDSRVEIAAIAKADGLTGSYLAASVSSPLLDPAVYGAPRSTPNLEGFLFPATYDLRTGANVSLLVGAQLNVFPEHFGPAEIAAARRLRVTPYQLIIVASMIEREALLPSDGPKVAAVIYNRLRLHMTLGIDATIRYALNDWTHPLTERQLQINSPYNTRLHTGLPPTPIGNPGDADIAAAAHPARVPYIYYVAGPDGCGELRFSVSAAAFDRNVAAYQRALADNGGNVPTCHR